MSDADKPTRARTDADQTHWWIAYAMHSSVDGTSPCDKSARGTAAIIVSADAALTDEAPKSATDIPTR